MKSAVFGIGRELISAQTRDSNAYFIASKLRDIGVDNRYMLFLDDDLGEISETLLYFSQKVDLIITSGGLGPTFDDLTLQAVALAFKKQLVLSHECLSDIKKFYDNLYGENKITDNSFNENKKKMAYIPEYSALLKNTVGAACGIYMKTENTHIFCLPGVPAEMQRMFENALETILKANFEPIFTQTETIDCEINDESLLTIASKATTEKTGVYVKTLPIDFSSKNMSVRFTSKAPTISDAKSKLNQAKAMFRESLSRL